MYEFLWTEVRLSALFAEWEGKPANRRKDGLHGGAAVPAAVGMRPVFRKIGLDKPV